MDTLLNANTPLTREASNPLRLGGGPPLEEWEGRYLDWEIGDICIYLLLGDIRKFGGWVI